AFNRAISQDSPVQISSGTTPHLPVLILVRELHLGLSLQQTLTAGTVTRIICKSLHLGIPAPVGTCCTSLFVFKQKSLSLLPVLNHKCIPSGYLSSICVPYIGF